MILKQFQQVRLSTKQSTFRGSQVAVQVAMGDACSYTVGTKSLLWPRHKASRRGRAAHHSRADGIEARSVTARSSATKLNFTTFVFYYLEHHEGRRCPCSGSRAGLRFFGTSGTQFLLIYQKPVYQPNRDRLKHFSHNIKALTIFVSVNFCFILRRINL